jgi:hypothetical protein
VKRLWLVAFPSRDFRILSEGNTSFLKYPQPISG